mgnify:CR=1 FL=1
MIKIIYKIKRNIFIFIVNYVKYMKLYNLFSNKLLYLQQIIKMYFIQN